MSEKREAHTGAHALKKARSRKKKTFSFHLNDRKTSGAKKKTAAKPEEAKKSTQADLLASPPTLEQLEKELNKSQYRTGFARVLRNTLFSLVVVAAVSALIAVLFLPVLQIHGTSMAPTLNENDIVVLAGVGRCSQGDLIAFYYNNNILIKRVIATAGDWVEIDDEGNVTVNGVLLDEPYISEKARGDCDISFPYQVPDGQYFVMGDHRDTSIDSRSTLVGCISNDMVIGRLVLRVWPFKMVGIF